MGVFFLRKSMIISLVLDMFSSRLFFLHQSLNFLSIHRLVSIVDTATYSGVILELNHANRLVTRYTVVCKESEKERRKHAALWGTSVKNNWFGEIVVDLDRLRYVKKKVESPMTDGRMHIQRYRFIKQLHRNYQVRAGIFKHLPVLAVKASFQSNRRVSSPLSHCLGGRFYCFKIMTVCRNQYDCIVI